MQNLNVSWSGHHSRFPCPAASCRDRAFAFTRHVPLQLCPVLRFCRLRAKRSRRTGTARRQTLRPFDSAGLPIGPIDCLLTSNRSRRSLSHEPSRYRICRRGRRSPTFWPRGGGLPRQPAHAERPIPLTRGRTWTSPVRPGRPRPPESSDRAATVVAQARADPCRRSRRVRRCRCGARSVRGRVAPRGHYDGRSLSVADSAAGNRSRAPRTPLYLVEDLTDRLLARLRDGALDAAVIATDLARDRTGGDCGSPMNHSFWSSPVIPASAGARRSGSRRSIPSTLLLLAEGHCLRDQALALCNSAERTALGADVRGTSLETLRHLASAGQGTTLAPLLAYADWRRSGGGIAGLRIVGDGASRLVRLVFKCGSPRQAAIEALAASLRSTANAALVKSSREAGRDLKPA